MPLAHAAAPHIATVLLLLLLHGAEQLATPAAATLLEMNATECSPPFTHSFAGRCYHYSLDDQQVTGSSGPQIANWTTAQATCEAMGGNLVSIHSREENEFVWGALGCKDNAYGDASNLFKWARGVCWIGLRQPSEAAEFDWVNGAQKNVLFWAPGEPNNNLGQQTPEDCAMIWNRGGSPLGVNEEPFVPARAWNPRPRMMFDSRAEWNDEPCDRVYPFVCTTDAVCPAGWEYVENSISFSPGNTTCTDPSLLGANSSCINQCLVRPQTWGDPNVGCSFTPNYDGRSDNECAERTLPPATFQTAEYLWQLDSGCVPCRWCNDQCESCRIMNDACSISTYGSCRQCPAGTYSDSVGKTACTACPTGTTSSPGSTSASDCTASTSPTFNPSSSPTSSPTASPTGSPTSHPSDNPTTAPTAHPTHAPTRNPTADPTSSPSSASPTLAPTAIATWPEYLSCSRHISESACTADTATPCTCQWFASSAVFKATFRVEILEEGLSPSRFAGKNYNGALVDGIQALLSKATGAAIAHSTRHWIKLERIGARHANDGVSVTATVVFVKTRVVADEFKAALESATSDEMLETINDRLADVGFAGRDVYFAEWRWCGGCGRDVDGGVRLRRRGRRRVFGGLGDSSVVGMRVDAVLGFAPCVFALSCVA